MESFGGSNREQKLSTALVLEIYCFYQQAEGLPLIILIRLSPFPPYVYSQALFAVSTSLKCAYGTANDASKSISEVKFWQFMLATVFYQSRIFLSVFVGSRIALFSDEKQRGQMDSCNYLVLAYVGNTHV